MIDLSPFKAQGDKETETASHHWHELVADAQTLAKLGLHGRGGTALWSSDERELKTHIYPRDGEVVRLQHWLQQLRKGSVSGLPHVDSTSC